MNAVVERQSASGRTMGGARAQVAGVPYELRRPLRRRGIDRSEVWRRPAGTPAALPRRAVRMSTAGHAPAVGVAERRGLVAAVAVAVLLALVILAAAQVRSIGATTMPGDVNTVEVSSGDTLSSIARQAAPDVPVGQMVDRIIALNELDSAAVHAGQSLVVPWAYGR
ncbi:LysM peptidoglycan-binding domain-containing protein [Tomitella gaofuii]|uniref:LysM peptidoglycan-binding domain-containing protein n=1 Tax=Tomitella gaofuii TaxID=2760083 RepID=UPI0015FB6D52|nr:LysM peptidoglycan-binding domain-containing protein [Tomitella gaofuii]